MERELKCEKLAIYLDQYCDVNEILIVQDKQLTIIILKGSSTRDKSLQKKYNLDILKNQDPRETVRNGCSKTQTELKRESDLNKITNLKLQLK